MKQLILILFCIVLYSCGKNSEEKQDETPIDESSDINAAINIPLNETRLDPEANRITANWAEYIVTKNEIEKFKNTSVNQLTKDSSILIQIIESLEASIPDSLKAVPVRSRIRVLNTKAHVLYQKTHLQHLNSEEIKKIAQEIPTDFSNLNIQINELFIESIEDFEAELDKLMEENLIRQERKKDSLKAIEN